jgi:hypothetical protein
MSTPFRIDRATAARMSLKEIGELLVRHRLLEPDDVAAMSLHEMRIMLAYLAGVRPDARKPDYPHGIG